MGHRAVPGWMRPRDGASLFLALKLCATPGCGRKSEPGQGPAGGRLLVMGGMTPAGGAASGPSPAEPAPADSVSAVTYPSLVAARETVVPLRAADVMR